MKYYLFYLTSALLIMWAVSAIAQPKLKIENGLINIDDGSFIKVSEKKYASYIDSLDHQLKAHPNDTTGLLYRAFFYLQFNGFVVNPDLSTNKATNILLLALKMAGRADSLGMQDLRLKVVRAQICKELTTRYAPIETWRFDAKQMADRKKRFDHFMELSNRYYDQLALIDKNNAYDYQRLKVKGS